MVSSIFTTLYRKSLSFSESKLWTVGFCSGLRGVSRPRTRGQSAVESSRRIWNVSGTGRVRGREGGSGSRCRSVGEDELVFSRSTYMMRVSSSLPRTSSRS